jgi:hypothetical protein
LHPITFLAIAIDEDYKGFSKKKKMLSVLPLPYTRSDARYKTGKGGSKPQGQFDAAQTGFEQTLDFQFSKYTELLQRDLLSRQLPMETQYC